MLTKKYAKSAQIFSCVNCDFLCYKTHDYVRHLSTRKHTSRSKIEQPLTNFEQEITQNKTYVCNNCAKIYKSRVGLWYHEKKCVKTSSIMDVSLNDINSLTNLVLEIVKSNTELQKQSYDFQKQCIDYQKQNNELQKQVMEVCKNGISNNTSNNNNNNNNTNNTNNIINSHNKTFNLNVFLNEECKDAMNLTDFMNSFQLKLDDLEKVGMNGYVDGVSNIIIKRLRDMDVNKRPMHCSDSKREIMYIKEENKWEKEPFGNAKLKKAISIIENKNIKLLGEWKEAHPTWMEYDSPDNDICMNLIIQTMSNCDEIGNKVIKKLAKEVVIDK
jgi:hypothetical protein